VPWDLEGHEAILQVLADLGLPTTRRALHRWTTSLQGRRRPPIRHELRGNQVRLVSSSQRLIRWVVRMDEEGYAGFTKIRALSRRSGKGR
jgi:hypothetical protein